MEKTVTWQYFFIRVCVCLSCTIFSKEETIVQRTFSHTITLQMAPIVATPIIDTFELSKLPDDQKFLKTKLTPHSKGNGGVIVTYMGYFTIFNQDGIADLPRKNDSTTLHIIVTKHINPVIIRGQTIEFFLRKENAPVAYYEFERIENKEKEFFWQVRKLDTPPSLKIAPEDIVICAKPDELFIPTGTFTTFGGQNLLLPPLYPTKLLKRNLNALSFLKFNRRYFRSLDQNRSYRYQTDRYASLINPI